MAGRGSDAQGNFVALGFGSETCQIFLQAQSNGLDLPYRHWLTGYLTAVNKLTKETVDIRGTTDIDGLLVKIAQYCVQHPRHSFSRAVDALVKDLYTQAHDTHATITRGVLSVPNPLTPRPPTTILAP